MNIVPKLLSLFDFDISKKSFDGAFPVGTVSFSGKDGDFADIVFSKPVKINLFTLFEKGESVTDFEISAEINGEFKRIYRQNRISKFRLCAVSETESTSFRIRILKTRKGSFGKITACAYNMPKKERELHRTAYVVTNNIDGIDAENLKKYNKFNIIGGINIDEKGGISFTEQSDFLGALSLIRTAVSENADIVVTLGGTGSLVKTFKRPETAKNIKAFIDKYNLNGISFDWEYPKGPYEWRVFDKFLIRLKETIGEKTITLALASWLRYRFSGKALAAIDTAEIMTYDDMARDIDGHHSEFFIDGPNAVYHFVRKGFKLSQLNLGLPFYARPADGTAYWKDYKAEADELDEFTNVVCGDYEDVDADKKKIIVKNRFYNCPQMIADKTAFCIYAGVGGVMVWHIGIDVHSSHKLCLTNAIVKTENERTE